MSPKGENGSKRDKGDTGDRRNTRPKGNKRKRRNKDGRGRTGVQGRSITGPEGDNRYVDELSNYNTIIKV